jgi:hypothetical protein
MARWADEKAERAGRSASAKRERSMPRPRFSPEIETVPLVVPDAKKLGGIIAVARSPEGHLLVLHQWNPPGVDVTHLDADNYLPDVARFDADGTFIAAWGGPAHIPHADGVPQWPAGREGIECDAEGNIWIFGYSSGDDAALKFSATGELLMRIGQRGVPGTNRDTQLLKGPTSCYHDVAAREVFITDGYGNHRVISFDSDTGAFKRMWGAYGKHPAELSHEEGFGNPVHKIVRGPNGRFCVCDRIKNRIQEFEVTPDSVLYRREVVVGPGTTMFGSTFDLGFSPCGRYMLVADGSNIRVWSVDLESFAVLGWASGMTETEGDGNISRIMGLLHRCFVEANGDILMCCTSRGLKRLKYLGVK